MPDIRLTAGNDSLVQSQGEGLGTDYYTYYGLAGDDSLVLYRGTVLGGPGNDRIEKAADAPSWAMVSAVYWESPAGVEVDLGQGWALDGYGTRDTLVGVDGANGSARDDKFYGNDNANSFYPNGGNDTIDGRGGMDRVYLYDVPNDASGNNWRPAVLSDFDISVSPDARDAVLTLRYYPKIRYTLKDVEQIVERSGAVYDVADLLRPQDMAYQAIAAGGGLRWNADKALGSAVQLSYSFVQQAPGSGVGASGFRAFSAAEQQVVRDILAEIASFSGLAFVEVAEAGGSSGQLRFGASQQTSTKGQSWMPNQPGAGDLSGDVWMDLDSLRDLSFGSEGRAALLHEIGHALGLRHPRNVDAGDAWSAQLRLQDDRSALSVMSQTASPDGLVRGDFGPLDVLALRYLYGQRSVHTGDDRYVLGSREAAAQLSIVDDGGTDTLDASALAAGVKLDLVPGHVSSAGVTVLGINALDNLAIEGSTLIENAIGSAFDDVLLGNALDNRLEGGAGNDWIDGAAGIDTAVFSGRRSDYVLSTGFGKFYLTARDGKSGFDTLTSIERLQFADQLLLLSPTVLAADASFRIDEDGVLSATLPLPSDLAAGGASYRLVANGAHGSASISASGALSYTPQPNYWGQDAITFEVSGSVNGTAGSNRYVAYVDVLPVNDAAPVSKDAAFLVQGGAVFHGRLPQASDADGDAASYLLSTEPASGRVTVLADGAFIYESASGAQQASDSFGFTVSDGMGGTSSYTASITLGAVAMLIAGTDAADTLGPSAADGGDGYSLLGGDDRVTPGAGADMVDGGEGIDTVAYSGPRSRYQLKAAATHWTVTDTGGPDGIDSLVAVERLQFKDKRIALDLDGNAGSTAQVIRAVLGAAALKTPLYVGYGLQALDGGMSYEALVAMAIGATPLAAASNRSFVQTLYRNVAGVAIDEATLGQLSGLLDAGVYTKTSLGVLAAQHALNTQSVELTGLAGTGLEFVMPGG